MITKGLNNIRAIIETQHGIISQIIYDLTTQYQQDLRKIQEKSQRIAEENSNGDYNVYFSILNSFNDKEENCSNLLIECRKIIFCAIFSYYEAMLHGLIQYYNITSRAIQIEQLFESIKKSYKERYNEDMDIDEEKQIYANEFCRLLRNYYMHGELSREKDKKALWAHIKNTKGIRAHNFETIIIQDNQFLYNTLDLLKDILVKIDYTFTNKLVIKEH